MTETTHNSPSPSTPSDQKGTLPITSSIAVAVLFGLAAAMLLHAVQWLFGLGWGSLWGFMSSAFIFSLGCSPWVFDPEGPKSFAGFGACVGAALGIAYGWFSGGLFAGVIFCASIGTWTAWVAGRNGLTTKAAQVGAVIVSLTAFHISGMLSPTSGESVGDPYSDDYWYAEAFDEAELATLKVLCAISHPLTGERDLSELEGIVGVLSLNAKEAEKAYVEARQAVGTYKGGDKQERKRLQRQLAIAKGTQAGFLKIAAPFLTR